MDSGPQTANRETTQAERVAQMVATFNDQGLQEFDREFHRQRRMRGVEKSDHPVGGAGQGDWCGIPIAGTATGASQVLDGLTDCPSQELGLSNIGDAMKYQPWHQHQMEQGEQVRDALTFAAKVILRCVPRSPLRTRALNNIIDCRMLANAAITFGGRF